MLGRETDLRVHILSSMPSDSLRGTGSNAVKTHIFIPIELFLVPVSVPRLV